MSVTKSRKVVFFGGGGGGGVGKQLSGSNFKENEQILKRGKKIKKEETFTI